MCFQNYFGKSAFVLHIGGWDDGWSLSFLTTNSRTTNQAQKYNYFMLHIVYFLRIYSRMILNFECALLASLNF